jgi:glycosyltransferase involved in cell wall biosynthesis
MKRKISIAFLTTHLGIFGSIRELLENANRLVRFGHNVTIYTQDGIHPTWMLCLAKVVKAGKVIPPTDVLIMMDMPFNYNMEVFEHSRVPFKTFIMMGFDDTTLKLANKNGILINEAPGQTETERNLLHILRNYTICADANWQLDHFRRYGIKTGVGIGGINTQQFRNHGAARLNQIGYSGDRRPRKGLSNLLQALQGLPLTSDFYFGKRYDQWGIPCFLNNTMIFIDNHLRAGWCNPVLEAIACGCVCICHDIPAVRDFAINGLTAFVLQDNSHEKFREVIKEALAGYTHYYNYFSRNSIDIVKTWDYETVTKQFETFILEHI